MHISHKVVPMDPRLMLHHALENLRNHGGQVGGWTINPTEDAKIRGGMGTILIGQRRNMRNQLEYGAIKFQLPEGLPDGTLFKLDDDGFVHEKDQLFEHEFSVLRFLENVPGNGYILKPFDSGSHQIPLSDGTPLAVPFFVTEFMQGQTLKDEVLEHGSLSGETWLDFAHDLLCAAVAIHQNGVIHQDIKPDNIMYHNGRYVLVDFGLASYINKPDPGDSGGGTFGYIAPEQFYSDRSKNQGHVDIYSIGATLVYAGSGHGPWDQVMQESSKLSRSKFQQALFDAMMSVNPDLAGLTKRQHELVVKMLNPDFKNRPSAEYFLELIVKAMAPTNVRKKNYLSTLNAKVSAKPKPAVQVRNKPAVSPVKTSSPNNAKDALEVKRPLFEPMPSGFWWTLIKIVTLGIAFLVVRNLHSDSSFKDLSDAQRRKYRRLYLLVYIPFAGGIAVAYLAPKFGSLKMLYLAGLAFLSSAFALSTGSTYFTLLSIIWTILGLNTSAKIESSGSFTDWNLALKNRLSSKTKSPKPQKTKKSKKQKSSAPSGVAVQRISETSPEDRAFAEDENGKPLYPLTWGDITSEIYSALISSKNGRFSFDVESPQLTGLFFQGYLESDGSATIECAADLSVRPKITIAQKEALVKLGWEPPTQKLPNFIKFMDLEDSDGGELSQFMSTTIRVGYQVPIEGLRIN